MLYRDHICSGVTLLASHVHGVSPESISLDFLPALLRREQAGARDDKSPWGNVPRKCHAELAEASRRRRRSWGRRFEQDVVQLQHCPDPAPSSRQSHGSVLILALWVLFLLGSLALAVGSYVSSGILVASDIKARTLGYELSRSAIARAVMELMNDTNSWDGLIETWSHDEEKFKNVALDEGHFSLVHGINADTNSASGSGLQWSLTEEATRTIRYGMTDEESKINISKAKPPLLTWIIRIAGEVDEGTATDIAYSIKDWRDEDDDVELTGGAESGYYRALGQPYSCHNGNFDSLYELLLVKGMTAELFARLAPHLTIHGTGWVNINTADRVVLESVAAEQGGREDVRASLVDKILEFRRAGNVFTVPDAGALASILGDFAALDGGEARLLEKMKRSVHVRSTCFRGAAVGTLKGRRTAAGLPAADVGGADRRVDFVYDRQQRAMVYWYEY